MRDFITPSQGTANNKQSVQDTQQTYCNSNLSESAYAESAHNSTYRGQGWSTQRIAITALLCAVSAISTLVLEFPIMPGITYLKYDPSCVIAVLGGLLFDPVVGLTISIIPYLVHVATSSGIYGTIMAIIAAVSYVMPPVLLYRWHKTQRSLIVGLLVGSICSILACIIGNLLITPLYTGMPIVAVTGLIVPVIIPFNVIKSVLNGALTLALFVPVSRAFTRSIKH